MGSLRSSVALSARSVTVAVATTALVAMPAMPAASARPVLSQEATASQGWTVDKARFEPLDPPTGPLSIENVGAYRGNIEVTAGAGGLNVVNEVSMDDYVKGISEVPATWPEAALEAQAIAARTFVLNQKDAGVTTAWRAAGADICASDACQVYSGVAAEERPEGTRWARAVETTTGQVLMADDRPILAKYSSSNGGRSVPGPARYLRAVNDPDDATSPLHRWDHTVPLVEIASVLQIEPTSRLLALDRRGDDVVMRLRLGEQDSPDWVEDRVPTAAFVATVNAKLPRPPGLPLPLPSWQFSFETVGSDVVIHGRGHGHGIGLSQYGALGRARRGQSASEILAAYYGGIRPSELPAAAAGGSLRVALRLDHPDASVSSPRYFRVLDGAGNVIVPVAVGRWRVVPAGPGAVRVLPPEGYDTPLTLTATGVEPAEPGPGDITLVRFSLSAPAVITVRFTPPGVEPGTNPSRVVDAGEVVEWIPAPAVPGDYQVTLQADAGPGRQAVLPLTFRASAPRPAVTTGANPTSRVPADGRVLLAASAEAPDAHLKALGGASGMVTLAAFALLLATRRTVPD